MADHLALDREAAVEGVGEALEQVDVLGLRASEIGKARTDSRLAQRRPAVSSRNGRMNSSTSPNRLRY